MLEKLRRAEANVKKARQKYAKDPSESNLREYQRKLDRLTRLSLREARLSGMR